MYNIKKEHIMLALRLEKALEDRIAKLAAAKGSNKSAVVRDAVIRYLEDQEDAVLARYRVALAGLSR